MEGKSTSESAPPLLDVGPGRWRAVTPPPGFTAPALVRGFAPGFFEATSAPCHEDGARSCLKDVTRSAAEESFHEPTSTLRPHEDEVDFLNHSLLEDLLFDFLAHTDVSERFDSELGGLVDDALQNRSDVFEQRRIEVRPCHRRPKLFVVTHKLQRRGCIHDREKHQLGAKLRCKGHGIAHVRIRRIRELQRSENAANDRLDH